jgi:hypothetical protein
VPVAGDFFSMSSMIAGNFTTSHINAETSE